MASINQLLTPKQKALEINLNEKIYGTFAEVGAGQETVRHFFRAGGASGTIAKAMSAYDKDFSDAIYGKEEGGRYVNEARLMNMLDHEVGLLEQRINRSKNPGRLFFSYANSVQTINFNKTNKGHGWVGIRFQLSEMEPYNDIIIHIRFHENDARLQQESLGNLGVNLIYGAFYYADNPRLLLESLYDELAKDQIEIDMVNFLGPRFAYVDNRLMSLQLVKNGMTDAVIFGPDGRNLLPADVLYKKNILAMRGSFRPVTNVNMDMLSSALALFLNENKVEKDKLKVLFEITLKNLRSSGEINERDFLDRADIIGKLGHLVLISNFSEYFKLVEYFSRFSKERLGLVMGVNNLIDVFDESYYGELSGGIMEAFGKLFTKDLKVYLYPFISNSGEKLDSNNLKVDSSLKELYKYIKSNKRLVDIEDVNESNLNILSREVLKQIALGEIGWEEKLPEGVAQMIKDRGMFGYNKGYIPI